MKKLCLEKVSMYVYDYFFSKKFHKNEWKMGHIIKDLEGEVQEVFYIGAGFEDRYWLRTNTLKHTHFYCRFIMGNEDIHSVSVYEKNAYIPEEELAEALKKAFRLQKIDILLHIKGYDRLNNLCSTGQKSDYILQLLLELRKVELFHQYDVEGLCFSYWFRKHCYHVKINLQNKQLILLTDSSEKITFNTLEEVKNWNNMIINEQKQIESILDYVADLIQMKTKWDIVALKKEGQFRINNQRILPVKIEKQINRGKTSFFVLLGDQKAKVSRIEDVEKNMQTWALEFCYKNRIRTLIKQK